MIERRTRLTNKVSTQELDQILQMEDVEATAEFTLRVEIAITRRSRGNRRAIEALLNVIGPHTETKGYPIYGFLEPYLHTGDITLDDIVQALHLNRDEKLWELDADVDRLDDERKLVELRAAEGQAEKETRQDALLRGFGAKMAICACSSIRRIWLANRKRRQLGQADADGQELILPLPKTV
jgi:hypothetical protein